MWLRVNKYATYCAGSLAIRLFTKLSKLKIVVIILGNPGQESVENIDF